MSKKNHTEWMKEDGFSEDDIGYFFHRNYSGAANVTLDHEGSLVFEGYNHSVVIENIGTKDERVIIKNAADLVV